MEPTQPMSLARKAALAGAGVLAVAVIIFVVQNSESVTVEWLGFTMEAPLFLIMILSGVTALGIRKLVAWGMRRRSHSAPRLIED